MGKHLLARSSVQKDLKIIEDPMLSMKGCRELLEIVEMPSEKKESRPSLRPMLKDIVAVFDPDMGLLWVVDILEIAGRKGHRCLMITYLVIGLILLLIFVTAAALFASWMALKHFTSGPNSCSIVLAGHW